MKRIQPNVVLPIVTVAVVVGFVLFWGNRGEPQQPKASTRPESVHVRIAYFPNVTHAPAIVGLQNGVWLEKLKNLNLNFKVVNAGPEAMEAMLANELDFSYVGPSPAVNAYLKTKGSALRIISGACQGGASLIRRADVQIADVKGLDGKRVAVPQLGGTQDVSCRHFLVVNGLKSKDQGGTVEIVAVKNPDILGLFKQKQLDAAWVPEPWASRIKEETGAVTVVDERDLWPGKNFTTTVLVVRTKFAEAHPEVVAQMISANADTITWMNAHQAEAKKMLNDGLKKLSGKALKDSVMDEAWSHVTFSVDPNPESVKAFAIAAAEAGYSKESNPNLANLFYEPPRSGTSKN